MDEPIVFQLPLTTQFRGITAREGVLLKGAAGWGEFSPFLEYDDAEAANWYRAAVEAAEVGWPEPLRDRIPVNATVPAVDPEVAADIVRESGGCTTVKVKVAQAGQDLQQDLNRVAAVRAVLGPAGKIRVDANGAWELKEALAALKALDKAAGGLEYAEQPVASVDDLARVRRQAKVLIAADESIRRAADPAAVVRAEAADVLVVKVQPLGGVRPALALAEELGLPVVVSSAVETAVGLAAGLALAAALPELPFACGLATGQLLRADVVSDPARPIDGFLPVGAVAPQGLALERAAARAAASPGKVAHWLARLAAVQKLVEPNLVESERVD